VARAADFPLQVDDFVGVGYFLPGSFSAELRSA